MKQAQVCDIHCHCTFDICWDNNWAGVFITETKGTKLENQTAIEGGNTSYTEPQDDITFPHFIVA